MKALWLGLVVLAVFAGGCTSYRGCETKSDEIVARYDQNIIRDEDGTGYAVWKGVKHGFFDIITLATCELWYSNVRSAYYATRVYGFREANKHRNDGQAELDSFLGVKLGEVLPMSGQDGLVFRPTKEDPNVYVFSPKRAFSKCDYVFRVHVTPKDRRVWKVAAEVDFKPSKEELAEAEAKDRNGPIRSYTRGHVDASGYYSGTTESYRSSDAFHALRMDKSRQALSENKRLTEMLTKRYGKGFVNGVMAFSGDRYLVMPYLEDSYFLRFSGLTLPKEYRVAVEAFDRRLQDEVKSDGVEEAVGAGTSGIDAF